MGNRIVNRKLEQEHGNSYLLSISFKVKVHMQDTFEMLLSHVGVVIKDHSQQTEAETPDHRLTEGPGWETEWKGPRLLNMHL